MCVPVPIHVNVFMEVKFICECICRIIYDLLNLISKLIVNNGHCMCYNSVNPQGFMTFRFHFCSFIILVSINFRKQWCNYQKNLPNQRVSFEIILIFQMKKKYWMRQFYSVLLLSCTPIYVPIRCGYNPFGVYTQLQKDN